jgi:hypothetical protein
MGQRLPPVVRTVIKTVLLTLAAHLAIIVIVFGTVNPFGWLWGERFPTATANTRPRKVRLYESWRQAEPVSGLIMGSSRSHQLPPQAFSRATGLRFFNFSVEIAMPEDFLAILDFVEERQQPPRVLVLGIDHTMLQTYPLTEELATDWELSWRVEHRRPTTGWKVEHGAQLLRKALTPGFARAVGSSIDAAVRHKEPMNHFRADGVVDYPPKDRAIAAGRYDRPFNIDRCVREFMKSLEIPRGYDPRRIALIDSLISHAKARGTQVVLWLTPLHPALYAETAARPAIDAWLRTVPDTLALIAQRHGVPFVNLWKVEDFGGDANDFYDCAHVGPKNVALLTEQLIAAIPNTASPAGSTKALPAPAPGR